MEENITIEFVRNWIEKHHLTRKSYESVLTDTLTNNGHYYIDNPYLRDWIIKNTEMFRNILPYELNENQQVVLDWLKREAEKRCDSPLKMIQRFVAEGLHKRLSKSVYDSYLCLTEQEQFKILQAFAEWGMKEVAE